MVIYSNVQIVLWWIVLIIPNIVGAVATFAYFVLGKKSKIYSIIIYLVAIWGMFRIIYSNYNLIVHANQYLSMNSTVRLVLEIAIHCLVIYQTYVLWIKRQKCNRHKLIEEGNIRFPIFSKSMENMSILT